MDPLSMEQLRFARNALSVMEDKARAEFLRGGGCGGCAERMKLARENIEAVMKRGGEE